MKQDEFFKLLDRRLSVIEDGERRDILDEYRQHISMKVREDHISEEEALADFGDVDSFADEILSAYHVRTGNTFPAKASGLQMSRIRKSAGSFWGKLREFFCRCGRNIAHFFHNCGNRIRGLFRREKREPKPRREGRPLWKCVFSRVIFAVRTLLRWCCNLVCGGAGLIFFVTAAFLLVMLGACVVVAAQGYPLVGTCVLLLGMLLCSGALGLLLWRAIRKKEDSEDA